MKLYIDIESRSPVNLKKTGVYVYAEHPLTEIIVFCWALGREPVQTWFPLSQPMPERLAELLDDPSVTVVAHNASFERIMLSFVMGFTIPIHRWDCTASRAARYGLPRTLDGAAAALGLPVVKDRAGYTLMMAMCKPRKPRKGETGLLYRETPADLERLGAYCVTDVEVERLIDANLPQLSETEYAIWSTTEQINDRGIEVDQPLLAAVSALVDAAEADVNARISEVTGGVVPRVSDHMALTRWLTLQGFEDAEDHGVAKEIVAALLDRDDINPGVRNVLAMRQEAGGTASKKYAAIRARQSADGRVRGYLVYCGASGTGRWSSRGVQLQNLKREAKRSLAAAIRDLLAGATLAEIEDIYGPALVLAAELLRPIFIAALGQWIGRGDYSQIEARVIAWLAGAEHTLDAFRRYDAGGPDIYRITAAAIYGIPLSEVTAQQRQVGKVAILAWGFGGGVGAFQQMAKAYNVKISDEYAETAKIAWRLANPEIVQLWYDLETAAMRCMRDRPGTVHPVGNRGVWFKRSNVALAMRMPSGNSLVYWTPRIGEVETPWGEMRVAVICRTEDAKTKQWVERSMWGGLFAENLTQATARDIMADAMIRVPRPVLTVHDEAVSEIEAETSGEAAAIMAAVMKVVPAWCAGLPIASECSAARRYQK